MPRESVRSLRAAAVAVGALGALSLAVPASLWMTPQAFPVLRPADHSVQARGFDSAGRQLGSPAQIRPGASTEIVVTGFQAGEPVRVRRSPDATASSAGRADQHGVFRYWFTARAAGSGAQSVTVIGSLDKAGPPRVAVFGFVVSADQAGGH